jgi:hypothetical protein
MNIMPKTVYDYLNEDPLIPVSWCLELADSTEVQPYGMVRDVLIEVWDSSILLDFIVIDMDPRQKISIILGKPFLKSVNTSINKKCDIIKIKIDERHERFIFWPKDPAYHQFQIEHVGTLPRELEQLKQPGSSQNMGQKKIAKSSRKKPDVANYSTSKFSRRVKNATPTFPKSVVTPVN